uniref:Uncharacterized protein n=1 Tax=Chryseobacterium sp. B5 TaxID=2050562 RepID=A0A2G7T3X2_9FLAO
MAACSFSRPARSFFRVVAEELRIRAGLDGRACLRRQLVRFGRCLAIGSALARLRLQLGQGGLCCCGAGGLALGLRLPALFALACLFQLLVGDGVLAILGQHHGICRVWLGRRSIAPGLRYRFHSGCSRSACRISGGRWRAAGFLGRCRGIAMQPSVEHLGQLIGRQFAARAIQRILM